MNYKSAYSDPLVGKRVRVLSSKKYHDKLVDQTGTVKGVWGTGSIGVSLDFSVNEGSSAGLFYFRISELEVINNETKTATAENEGVKTMSKLTNYVNVAEVSFLDGQPFRTISCANYDTSLCVGDLCVVQTKSHGMGLAQVEEIREPAIDEALYREIVSRVDTIDFNTRVERRQKTAELKAKMEARAKQLQDIALYQALAKEDPAMAQLLQELKDLNG